LLSLLFTPINLIYALLTRSFRILGYLFPFLPRLLARISGYSQPRSRGGGERKQLQPRDSASRFIREFTEDYGSNQLPFLETSYASALDTAKRDLSFLLVVLLSPEHDDTNSWVRETLLAPNVSSFLSSEQNNNILLWGGSVQDSEPYQVSLALNTTKFPFAALIAHTPSVSATAMSVVTRLVGPMPAAQFLSKVQRAVEQYGPGLEEVRRKRREADAARSLREQQNTAYERSLAQDRERARMKREAEERRAREEKEAMKVIEEKERRDRNVKVWRKWRAARIEAEPGQDVTDAVRISVRMPDGERVVRRFRGDKELEELYAFVECWDILKGAQEKDVVGEEPDDDFKHEYGFRLVSLMPRESYELDDGGTIAQRIGRSGNFIVEKTHHDEDENDEEE
jgi:FAS-associated factor 2